MCYCKLRNPDCYRTRVEEVGLMGLLIEKASTFFSATIFAMDSDCYPHATHSNGHTALRHHLSTLAGDHRRPKVDTMRGW